MKKIYTQPEWKVISYAEDLITTSGDGTYNPSLPGMDEMFSPDTPTDSWEW